MYAYNLHILSVYAIMFVGTTLGLLEQLGLLLAATGSKSGDRDILLYKTSKNPYMCQHCLGNDVFIAFSATPATVVNVDFFEGILQT